jgi:hypothetical protein
MKSEDTIQVGDWVKVVFSDTVGDFCGEVIAHPSVPNDTWIFKNEHGDICHINPCSHSFIGIFKLRRSVEAK